MGNGVTAVPAAQRQLDPSMQQAGISGDPGLTNSSGGISSITAKDLVGLLIKNQASPIPEARDVFPWLHGISPSNTLAVHFLASRYCCSNTDRLLMPPKTTRRLLVVDYSEYDEPNLVLRGSIPVNEILDRSYNNDQFVGRFLDTDLRCDLQFRNFSAQPAKLAQVCDILVYTSQPATNAAQKTYNVKKGLAIAKLIHQAQLSMDLGRQTLFYPDTMDGLVDQLDHTKVLQILRARSRDLPSADLRDCEIDPYFWETGLADYEMSGIVAMTRATPILPSVWMGNLVDISLQKLCESTIPEAERDLYDAMSLVSCRTIVQFADVQTEPPTLSKLDSLVRQSRKRVAMEEPVLLKVPGLAEFASQGRLDAKSIACIISMCKLLYVRNESHGILIASNDGYHLSSTFAAIYIMYSTGKSLGETLLYLHNECHRPASLSTTEVEIARTLEPVVYALSPTRFSSRTRELGAVTVSAIHRVLVASAQLPSSAKFEWLKTFPGTFPSRILDHLYLGSFEHADNPAMLRSLGITRIISVGEQLSWLRYPIDDKQVHLLEFKEVLHIPNFQDDGIDGILPHLPTCLELLARSEEDGPCGATLVHCRKGVSRSAAVCIAEVMRSRRWELPRAYVHVRVHRLDVIIQPNLRLMYDLLKFEEQAPFLEGRTIDWPVLCREISRLNRDCLVVNTREK